MLQFIIESFFNLWKALRVEEIWAEQTGRWVLHHRDQHCTDAAFSYRHALMLPICMCAMSPHHLWDLFPTNSSWTHQLCFTAWTVCMLFVAHLSSFLLSIHMFVDHPLCVSVPPHDVKRMAWNSTGNSSCPDSDHSQSSIPAAPLGSNTVTAKSNTKPSKSTSALTD